MGFVPQRYLQLLPLSGESLATELSLREGEIPAMEFGLHSLPSGGIPAIEPCCQGFERKKSLQQSSDPKRLECL